MAPFLTQSPAQAKAAQQPARAILLALMVTRRCNMTCAHCSVESGPHVRVEPSLDDLRRHIAAAAASGVHSILFTGGEPMLREKDVLLLMRETHRLGMKPYIATNGFWGATSAHALRLVRAFQRAGLESLTISHDTYHAAFQEIAPALRITRAAASIGLPVNINITRLRSDAAIDDLIAPFEQDAAVKSHVRLRFYDVQPVGRAREFDSRSLRGAIEGYCGGCRVPAITDDGRVTACNGPSYFAPEGSPLYVGSLARQPLETLIRKHAADPVLDTIRTFGPARLRDELRALPGFESFPLDGPYSGMCQLCTQITSDRRAVAALHARLSEEKFVAEREAKHRVLLTERRHGTLNFFAVNGSERARVFWHAARGDGWPKDTAQILGRADLDWKKTGEYLTACGVARPLVARLEDAELTRWAPRFFLDRLRAAAMRDGLRELIFREIFERLDAALQELDADGVLLKGAAMLVRCGPDRVPRAGGDVDVYVDPQIAGRLRSLLLERGFTPGPYAGSIGAHHLAPAFFRGVPVEIHGRLLPAIWGLPEAEALHRRVPVDRFARLYTLDPEARVLHALVHCTTHLFSHGVKTAWDVASIADVHGTFDWARLSRLAASCAAPRAFWTPLNVLRRDLSLEVPQDFASQGPSDSKQTRLELIARRRIHSATERAEDINPFSKNGVFLMLLDTPLARARLLASLVSPGASEARRNAWRLSAQLSSTPIHRQLFSQAQEAWRQWKEYRRQIELPGPQ